ncbi:hypothetical protein ACEPPN_009194 [Leptodophora sp. 'Broadleaf-Isolate-01']
MPSCHYERIPLSDDHPSPKNSTSPPSAPLLPHPRPPPLTSPAQRRNSNNIHVSQPTPFPAPETLLSDSTSEAWPEPEESLLLARAREIEAMDEDREALRRLCEQVRLIEERIDKRRNRSLWRKVADGGEKRLEDRA